MKAGRELNELVAIHVMGWEKSTMGQRDIPIWIDKEKKTFAVAVVEWNPSEEIWDAWHVVEKMQEDGYDFRLENIHEGYNCYFAKGIAYWDEGGVCNEKAPLAICSAALEAVGVEQCEK